MKVYEYMTTTRGNTKGSSMCDMGAKGWKLVAVETMTHGGNSGDTLLFWERAVEMVEMVSAETKQTELQILQTWKKEMMEVWGPVIEYAQKHGEELGLKPGEQISKKILNILKVLVLLKNELPNKKF